MLNEDRSIRAKEKRTGVEVRYTCSQDLEVETRAFAVIGAETNAERNRFGNRFMANFTSIIQFLLASSEDLVHDVMLRKCPQVNYLLYSWLTCLTSIILSGEGIYSSFITTESKEWRAQAQTRRERLPENECNFLAYLELDHFIGKPSFLAF